jgi:hypothetical protein
MPISNELVVAREIRKILPIEVVGLGDLVRDAAKRGIERAEVIRVVPIVPCRAAEEVGYRHRRLGWLGWLLLRGKLL